MAKPKVNGAVRPRLWTSDERITLDRIMFKMTAVDEGIEELDLSAQQELFQDGMVKVDNVNHILDKLELEANYAKKKVAEYQAMQRAAENASRRLRDYVLQTFQKYGFERFPGMDYTASIRRGAPSVELKVKDADAMLAVRYPEYVEATYTLKKSAIRDGLKNGDPAAADLGELKETKYVVFSINRDAALRDTETSATA